MADNVTADPGSGGATFATDDDGTAHWPYTKLAFGADNTQTIVSSSNPLPVVEDNQSVIDSNNSTSTPLTGDAVFTGTSTDVSNYNSVLIQIFADQDSASGGVSIETSVDGTNWDHSHSYNYDSSTGEAKHYEAAIPGQYFRVVYTNGSSAQSTFRMQTKLSKNSPALHVHPVNYSLDLNHPAALMRSVITGETTAGGGGLVNVKVNPSGTLEVNTQLELVEDTQHTTGDSGVMPLAVRNDTLAALAGTDGDYAPLQVNADGAQYVEVSSAPQGTSHYRNVDANAEAAIKSSAGTLFWVHAINLTASIAYLHLYDDTTGNVTPGSTTPDYTFPIPTQGDTNGAGFNLSFGGAGQAFSTAITLVVTTTIDGSAGDPGTNGVMINAGYS